MAEIGRPTVITPEVISKLEYAFALGCTDIEACLYSGIGKSALYEYQKEHPDFTERKAILKETPILKARMSVVNALEEDYKHALQFLERKKKDEFAPRQETTGANGEALIPLTNDQVNAIIARRTASSTPSGQAQPNRLLNSDQQELPAELAPREPSGEAGSGGSGENQETDSHDAAPPRQEPANDDTLPSVVSGQEPQQGSHNSQL